MIEHGQPTGLEPESIARRAAQTLSDELVTPGLLLEVERVFREGPDDETRLDGSDVISIATLLVSAAELAVAIYTGLTGRGAKTAVEIASELCERLKVQTQVMPEVVENISRHTVNAMFGKPR